MLLPVFNLTNLLAFHDSGLSFARFAVLMALPTLTAVAVEWVVISGYFGVKRTAGAASAPGDPETAGLGTGPVLAVLIGVNVGPNLTPVGSLAILLWRRVLAAAGIRVPAAEFARLGVLTVPAALISATVLRWAALQLGA